MMMLLTLIPIFARSPVRSSMAVTRRKLFVGVVCILLLGSSQPSALATEALDIRLPPLSQLDTASPAVVPAPPTAQAPPGGFIATLDAIIATLDAYAASARATQPDWSTPLTTTTGLLERRFRFDFSQQHSGNGTNTTVLDGNKSLELIVNETTEIQVGPPPYYIRSGVAGTGRSNKGAIQSLAGFNDWPFFRVKERLLSSPSSEGNYVLTALFQIQAPAGIPRLTNNSWEYIPTLAGGKGWGNFDIQATISTPVPASHRNIIGYQISDQCRFSIPGAEASSGTGGELDLLCNRPTRRIEPSLSNRLVYCLDASSYPIPCTSLPEPAIRSRSRQTTNPSLSHRPTTMPGCSPRE